MIPALAAALAEREAAGLYRRRRVVDAAAGPRMTLDGRPLVAFCSNDYLGLAAHPAIVAAFTAAAVKHGVGAGAAHLVSGHHHLHHELEDALAAYTGRERALLFSTGYMANLGIGHAFARRGALVVEDRLNHASLIDAGRGAGVLLKRYTHGDAAAAASALDQDAPVKLLVTDGVFSMDGDIAPLPALAAACDAHGAMLVVDDAHGLGVVGATGRGTLEQFGLDAHEVPVLMGTLGKAFGVFGAFVAGPAEVIETLIQQARTYIYTTALPPAVAAAALTALRVSDGESWRRKRVLALVKRFRAGAVQLGLPLADSPTPIQPLVVGGSAQALKCAQALEHAGFLVTPIRPPTVPDGTARLRVTLSAAHTDDEVDALLDALAGVFR
ncbi:MAG: 8-amino-7-oxononanoate synthase [Gammaproteobacteria bacterium]